MQLTIEKLNHEGRGIGEIEGKKVFVQGALPGETVRIRIARKHHRFVEAHIEEVLVASPEREVPACSAFGRCGGCALQHMPLSTQLANKQNALLELLAHHKVQPQSVRAPVTANSYGYRHKARLGVRYVHGKGGVLVGFREFATNKLADLQECVVLAPGIGTKIADLKAFISSLEAKATIAQIEVAVADEGVALVFRNLEPLSSSDLEKFKAFKKAHNFLCYLQPAGPDSVVSLEDEPALLTYTLAEFGLQYQFHPLDFIQINPAINAQMVKLAIDRLDLQSTDSVLDLFCGLGNFSLPMAQKARVMGVEGSLMMTERAGQNAARNEITTAQFATADLTQELQQNWAKQKYDKMLIDPPRSGCEALIPFIVKAGPKKIVYVSCDPATLARDAGLLCKAGYTLTEVGILDMFSHTEHVESLAVFDVTI